MLEAEAAAQAGGVVCVGDAVIGEWPVLVEQLTAGGIGIGRDPEAVGHLGHFIAAIVDEGQVGAGWIIDVGEVARGIPGVQGLLIGGGGCVKAAVVEFSVGKIPVADGGVGIAVVSFGDIAAFGIVFPGGGFIASIGQGQEEVVAGVGEGLDLAFGVGDRRESIILNLVM